MSVFLIFIFIFVVYNLFDLAMIIKILLDVIFNLLRGDNLIGYQCR